MDENPMEISKKLRFHAVPPPSFELFRAKKRGNVLSGRGNVLSERGNATAAGVPVLLHAAVVTRW